VPIGSQERYIALSDVNRLAQAFEREIKQLHLEDIVSTKLGVECFKSENISVFYKDKLGSPSLGSGLYQGTFVLCIRAPFQLEAFQRLGNGFLGIDATHNITHYKEMLLFTIMARDNGDMVSTLIIIFGMRSAHISPRCFGRLDAND
jgi:hypothetical protein